MTLAVCLAMMPFTADAAGLGKMNVSSALGEPLRAEIELLSVSPEELSSLYAAIAPEEAYAAQGVERTALHGSIKIELGKKADGSPVLKLSTFQPVSEPYLDMLIQVDWHTGRLIREYTALLDPPGYSSNANPATNSDVSEKKQPTRNVDAGQDALIGTSARPHQKTGKKQASQAHQLPENTSGNEYKIKQGDTLAGIAHKNAINGVSLDQMLVGLYKANTNVFVDGNINRLKVGQIIRLPSSDVLRAVDKQEASKEVQAQVANWNAYRNKLAKVVAESEVPGAETAKQVASGKITKPVEDKATPLTAGPRDVVKLSRSDVTAGKKTSGTTAQELQSALQEDAIANEKKVKEANERITALTKQLEDMKKVLELKSQALADLQKSAGQPAVETQKLPEQQNAKLAEAPIPSETAKIVTPQPETPALKTIDKHPKVAQPTPPVKAPVSLPPEGKGIVDSLIENAAMLGAAGAALALLVGGWLFMRNRRMNSLDKFEQDILTTGGLNAKTVFGSTSGGTVDTGDTSFLTAFTHGTGGMIDTHDVDPLAEAEVYMAYGREVQAEEILKDAITKEPKRYDLYLKLLEIYAGRKDSSAFEAIAGELYSTLGANHPIWSKVATIGHELEPGNPLYQTVVSTSDDSDREIENRSEVSALETKDTSGDIGVNDFVESEKKNEQLLDFTKEVKDESVLDFDSTFTTAAVEDVITKRDSDENEIVLGFDSTGPEFKEISSEYTASVDTVDSLNNDNQNASSALDMPDLQIEKSSSEDVAKDIQSEKNILSVFDDAETETISLELPVSDSHVDGDSITADQTSEARFGKSDELDFNFNIAFDDDEKKLDSSSQISVSTLPELNFADINLNLDSSANETVSGGVTSAVESTEVDTKLDLVTAYIDMDDKEGARELLEEVLKEGGAQQRQRAQRILDSFV
jgi:pilus assembly protein FimV